MLTISGFLSDDLVHDEFDTFDKFRAKMQRYQANKSTIKNFDLNFCVNISTAVYVSQQFH